MSIIVDNDFAQLYPRIPTFTITQIIMKYKDYGKVSRLTSHDNRFDKIEGSMHLLAQMGKADNTKSLQAIWSCPTSYSSLLEAMEDLFDKKYLHYLDFNSMRMAMHE